MSLIHLRGLGLLSPRPLFQSLDLAIHPGDRIGLVAGNGAGNTSLLRCLAGEIAPTTGQITRRRGLRLGHVPQEVPETLRDLPLTEAVRRGLPAAERAGQDWKVDLTLDMLQTPAALRDRPLGALSGGWRRVALLARAWIADPDLLLLDEPTNHLDLERLGVLEDWVNHATEGTAMLIASHDRDFLDHCTNRTLFLHPEDSRLYAHPYTRARALLAEDMAAREAKFARDAKAAEKLRRQAGQLRNVGINSGSDLLLKKSKYLNQRAEAIEGTLRPEVPARAGDIRLVNRGTHAKLLLTLDDVAVTAPDGTLLFRTGLRRVFLHDRILLLGANGAGKSHLLRLLRRAALGAALGEDVPGVSLAASVVTGYLDQMMAHLPAADTPLGFIAGAFRLGDQRSLSLLAGAGLDVDTQRRPIALLSPGQAARLGLLALRLAETNFYLLDEPTNHVDIVGRERLEAEILAQAASGVMVSHDRAFARAVGTRVWRIARGRLEED